MYYASLESFILFLKQILEEEYGTEIRIEEKVDVSEDLDDYDLELDCTRGIIYIKYINNSNEELLDEIGIPIDVYGEDLTEIEECSFLIDHYLYSLDKSLTNFNAEIYTNLQKSFDKFKKEEYDMLNSDDYHNIHEIYTKIKKQMIKNMC